MQLQLNCADIQHSDTLSAHVFNTITKSLRYINISVTRIEVHLRDDKKKRRGLNDKRCLIEVRIAGRQPLVIEARGRDIYDSVDAAAAKLEVIVGRRQEKAQQ